MRVADPELRQESPIPILLMARELGQGGSERQLTEIAKALDRRRFAVRVGCFRASGIRAAELAARSIPVVPLPVRSLYKASAVRGARELTKYLRRERIRLVHTFDTPLNCFAIPVARAAGVPVVLSSQRASRMLSSRGERILLRASDRLADAVIVNCEAVRRHMLADYGVPERKLRVCYNGIDTEQFRPLPARRPPVLADAEIVIGVICALRPEKGLETLIDAFATVASRRSGLRLAVIGSGPVLGKLEERSRALGVRDQCHFEPSTSEVAAWLRGIDIFVLPSLSEALSNSLMEAMACGCAVVASRVGGNPELVSDHETGLLFESGDVAGLASAIEELITDEALRSRVGAAAARMIQERFALSTSARRMEEIYDEFLSRR